MKAKKKIQYEYEREPVSDKELLHVYRWYHGLSNEQVGFIRYTYERFMKRQMQIARTRHVN